jgi:hypothetical protein
MNLYASIFCVSDTNFTLVSVQTPRKYKVKKVSKRNQTNLVLHALGKAPIAPYLYSRPTVISDGRLRDLANISVVHCAALVNRFKGFLIFVVNTLGFPNTKALYSVTH